MVDMHKTILEELNNHSREIISLRRTIHRHPELGNREWKTAELVESCLKDWGIETRRVLDTGVVGILRGEKPGRTLALRSDMDALPLQETSGAEYSSEIPGVMHGCGHDVHTSGLLGTARILALHREELAGTVVFIFQPDEEGNGGARRLIEAGALEGVDAILGAHVSPELEAGHVGVRYGKFYAASDMFTVKVTGRSAHGAEPEKGIDAIAAACEMINELRTLPGRLTDDKCVLTVGCLNGGTAGNIVADLVEFRGIVRTLGQETRGAMKEAFLKTIEEIGEKYGAETSVDYRGSYPGVVNDDGMTDLVADTAAEVLGEDRVHIIAEPTMMTEDFGYYAMEVPGCFFHVGAGCRLPLHNPGFLPVDEVPVNLTLINLNLIMKYLVL